ncbi:hypothetical protein Anapl_06935 [Anas platyrhynchos]|uniref:Uncharacterized protein n=1 Tax=Anas platyrhynchos TaxID=8839 RepID=R0LYN9_ANAPL|nr:hypothetical protein Anapl_06935 [Anas platyrhynchos]
MNSLHFGIPCKHFVLTAEMQTFSLITARWDGMAVQPLLLAKTVGEQRPLSGGRRVLEDTVWQCWQSPGPGSRQDGNQAPMRAALSSLPSLGLQDKDHALSSFTAALYQLSPQIWTKGLIPEVLFTYDKLANACSGHCRSQTTCLAKRQSCLGLPEGRAAASLPARCPERDAPGAHRRCQPLQSIRQEEGSIQSTSVFAIGRRNRNTENANYKKSGNRMLRADGGQVEARFANNWFKTTFGNSHVQCDYTIAPFWSACKSLTANHDPTNIHKKEDL